MNAAAFGGQLFHWMVVASTVLALGPGYLPFTTLLVLPEDLVAKAVLWPLPGVDESSL